MPGSPFLNQVLSEVERMNVQGRESLGKDNYERATLFPLAEDREVLAHYFVSENRRYLITSWGSYVGMVVVGLLIAVSAPKGSLLAGFAALATIAAVFVLTMVARRWEGRVSALRLLTLRNAVPSLRPYLVSTLPSPAERMRYGQNFIYHLSMRLVAEYLEPGHGPPLTEKERRSLFAFEKQLLTEKSLSPEEAEFLAFVRRNVLITDTVC